MLLFILFLTAQAEMNFEALSVSLRQMWHFNTVSKTKCQDGQEFQFSSLKDFCLVFPQQQSLQAASPASRSFLGNGELKLKLAAPSQMASRHKCLSETSLSKSVKILILFPRVLTANLIASANFGFALWFSGH